MSRPVVEYCETVTGKSSGVSLAKSGNKLNRFWMSGEPLAEEVVEGIECGRIVGGMEEKERGKVLVEEYEWDVASSRKVWCFGPERKVANVVVDETKGVQYLEESRGHFVERFEWPTKKGAVCSETMRGIRFNVADVTLHAERVHRSAEQMVGPIRSCLYVCELSAGPTLVEPVYLVDITVPQSAAGGVYSCVSKRRGKVVSEMARMGTPLVQIQAYLPVSESFGSTPDLHAHTSGQAFPQCGFDHWEVVEGSAYEVSSRCGRVVRKLREMKGMAVEVPTPDFYTDRL